MRMVRFHRQVRKLLTPQTAGGRALLKTAFFSPEGRRALRQTVSLRALTPLLGRWLQALSPWRLLSRLRRRRGVRKQISL